MTVTTAAPLGIQVGRMQAVDAPCLEPGKRDLDLVENTLKYDKKYLKRLVTALEVMDPPFNRT